MLSLGITLLKTIRSPDPEKVNRLLIFIFHFPLKSESKYERKIPLDYELSHKKQKIKEEENESLGRNCRRTLLTQLTDRF
jgi:hypothetical protein